MTTRNTTPGSAAYSHTAIVDDRIPDHLVALDVDVSLDGEFAPDVPHYARRKILAAAKHCCAGVTPPEPAGNSTRCAA